ncbi:MAG: ABC transporter permease [Anaerolineales bacterium]
MIRFISRRITFIILVSLLIIFATQLGMRMIRNSEVNQPNFNLVLQSKLAWRDTSAYLTDALQGNLGYIQEAYGLVRVRAILKEAYVNSMGLLLVAILCAIVVGISAGVFAAMTKHKSIILPLLMLTILGISTPSFFAGLLLRQGEIYYLRAFGHPLVSIAGFGWDYKHMLLPALVLMAYPVAYLTRATFLAFDRVMEEDFVRTAYSKGLTHTRTVNIHASKNIAIPILTAIGVSLRYSLSTLPIVEFFFLWPGMGLLMLEAIDKRQTDLVVSLALALGLTFLIINLTLDILYRFIDPRVREQS